MSKPPPFPLYPNKYDSDETLFLVYNTSESVLVYDNPAWADEIEIRPSLTEEVWADNGFANIGGELFYYNNVEKKIVNGNQRVFKLKECVRNLGGEQTKFNHSGEKVRGFVIAEHHNQIADAIIKIQNFIGINFSENKETLDWRIRNLQETPVVFDDYNCPEIELTFNIIENNPSTGVLAQYSVSVEGTITSFRLDFGDGEYTTTDFFGTHRYSLNSPVDPVLTVYNDKCLLTITPTERSTPLEPVSPDQEIPLEIPIPPPPDIPPILVTPFSPLTNKYNPPPIVFPCLDTNIIPSIPSIPTIIIPSTINISPINIPSQINISPINIPSSINITPINIPSQINISPININVPSLIDISPINIPSVIKIEPSQIQVSPIVIDLQGAIASEIQISPISVDSNIPSTITISPVNIPSSIRVYGINIPASINVSGTQIPSTISIEGNIPDTISVSGIPGAIGVFGIPGSIGVTGIPQTISVSGIPQAINVNYGPTPQIYVNWGPIPTLECTVYVQCPSSTSSQRVNTMSDSYCEQPEAGVINGKIEVESLGIPSSINIVAPEFSPIKINAEEVPKSIELIPKNIPQEIRLVSDIPKEIKINSNVPSVIKLDSSSLPESIKVIDNIPEFINLKIPDNFPSEIKLNTSSLPNEIKVVGIPPVIELSGSIPSTIQLVMPEKPEIEMVYKGPPIDVKIELDISKITGEDGKVNCVSIVPCK